MQKFKILPLIITALTALTLTSCSTTTAEQYEATALTSYSWQVKYANNLTSQPQPRIETFANTSVVNRNGVKPPLILIYKGSIGLSEGTGNRERGRGKREQEKLMVFKHEIEIMTGGGATPAPHCFFRCTLRSKKKMFFD